MSDALKFPTALDRARSRLAAELGDCVMPGADYTGLLGAIEDYIDIRTTLILANTDWEGARLVRIGGAVVNEHS